MEAPNSVKVVARDRYPYVTPKRLCLVSSAVRAAPLQGDGRRFNPVTRYHIYYMLLWQSGYAADSKPVLRRVRISLGAPIFL